MKEISILVVDDHHLVRTGLVCMLADMPGFVIAGEAESGEQALEKVEALFRQQAGPDVVLMDLRMPGIGGLEATQKITRRYPDVRIVAVTACDEQPFPQRFMECGASGFITKDAGIEEVAQAIRTVATGRRYLGREVAQKMALHRIGNAEVRDEHSPFERLSKRELQAALMIMDGMKTGEIADKLNVSPKTVNTYRYRLFEKLDIKSNMELALLATRHGLIELDAAGH
jgi:DNA-binding NarL/FixJ family response regulator